MPETVLDQSLEEVRACDLCDADEPIELFMAKDLNQGNTGQFRVVRCKVCGLVSINPRPTIKAIGRYYPQDYWRSLPSREEIHKAYGEIFDILAKLKPGRLLDVGTGGAYFPSLFQDWQREGTELSAGAAKRASSNYGFPVYPGLLEDNIANGKLKPSSYDLITFNHVIEHLYTPKDSIKRAHSLLKPNGMIMISTPNFDSIMERLTGPKWYHLDAPRHLYLFTPRLLKRLLEENGFKVVRMTYNHREHNRAGYSVSLGRLLEGRSAMVQRIGTKMIALTQSTLPRLFAAIGRGDAMAVFAQKVSE